MPDTPKPHRFATLAIHPATTTHRQLPKDETEAACVGPDAVRLSIGLENVEDLVADIELTLAQVG